MTVRKSGGSPRKFITRVLATGVMLSMYAFGMVAGTGAFMTAGISPAHAQRGRGGGGGRGRGGGGGGGAAAVGLGLLGLGIGAAIGAAAATDEPRVYRRARPSEGAIGYCMDRYKSYDPESGTYMGYDGQPHPCP